MSGLALQLIVGLGNPGDEYARTRHNAGFWIVDELARRHGGAWRRESRHQCELARARIGAADLWLVKPLNFMNRSGGPVASVANFYKITPPQILVVHDDVDLAVGVLRLKEFGGHGGHNGVRDLIAHLGEQFWRLRLGVGHPGVKGEVVDYLTGARASADEQRLLDAAVIAAADCVPVLLADGAQKAMNRLHSSAE
jgi:PTH1 family peptidyl-tRNA hydrolase